MFDKLRERIRTRQAYVNAPITYEVLGRQMDEKSFKWFGRNFGHHSLEAMFFSYFAFGMFMGAVVTAIATGSIGEGVKIGLVLSLVFGLQLIFIKHESKKVT